MDDIAANRERMREALGVSQIGGKGTQRRKPKKVHKASNDDQKLKITLKKLGCQHIPAVEEIVMYGPSEVLVFRNPQLSVAVASNTFVVTGEPTRKSMEEISTSMRQFADSSDELKAGPGGFAGRLAATGDTDEKREDNDDDVPDLVENFEAFSKES